MIVSGLLLHVCVCCCTCVRVTVAHVRFFVSRVVFVVARWVSGYTCNCFLCNLHS